MPNYGWTGPGQTREISHERAHAPKLEAPTSPDVSDGVSATVLFECSVPECKRRFRKRMIVARHFNASHGDLREDEDTWRDYVKEVTE